MYLHTFQYIDTQWKKVIDCKVSPLKKSALRQKDHIIMGKHTTARETFSVVHSIRQTHTHTPTTDFLILPDKNEVL